jgi:hypothetical protein
VGITAPFTPRWRGRFAETGGPPVDVGDAIAMLEVIESARQQAGAER